MRAVTISDQNLSLQDRPTPVATGADVVVRVHAAGLNAADLLQRQGFYPAPAGWPQDVPGLECAGVVSELGPDARGVAVGDRVAAIVGGGGQATHCVVPSEHLITLPDSMPFDVAGGFAEAFSTAYDALVRNACVRAGETVVISGAAGGVGVAAVQIARNLGARVVAVTRDERHHDALRALGADECLVTEQVADHGPYDVVVELVGAAHLSLAINHLAPFARVVVIGVGSGGSRLDINLLGLMSTRATLTGSTLRARSREEKALIAADVNRAVVPWWNEGRFQVPLASTFPIDQVDAAYESFAQSGKFGKIVLICS